MLEDVALFEEEAIPVDMYLSMSMVDREPVEEAAVTVRPFIIACNLTNIDGSNLSCACFFFD